MSRRAEGNALRDNRRIRHIRIVGSDERRHIHKCRLGCRLAGQGIDRGRHGLG